VDKIITHKSLFSRMAN